jgi:roadblock/LC7 domain-containing protein
MNSNGLSDLVDNTGVLAAIEFAADGTLTDHATAPRTRLTAESLDLLAHMCAANMSTATLQARGWQAVTGMNGFEPVDVVTLVGFEWSVSVLAIRDETASSVQGYRGIVYRNEGADYEAAGKLLHGA